MTATRVCRVREALYLVLVNASSARYSGATGAGSKTEESAVAMCSVVAGSSVQSYCNPNNFWRISNVAEAALFI